MQVSLIGMSPDDCIRLEMPPESRRLSLDALLDRAFPASPSERREIAAQFAPGTANHRDNPDLPDIYAVFLAVCEEWRDWRCALNVTAVDGASVALSAPVAQLAPSAGELVLLLEQQYCPLEYSERHGFWPARQELLDWMRSLTALYFLDKHEIRLYPDAPETAPALRAALSTLQAQGLIAAPDATAPYAIPSLGRRFIAALLTETESLIDHYDHYKDTIVDADRETAEFNTGHGADLRVAAFLSEGLDPIRAVFLLRLYDGTADHRLRDWRDAIESEGFFEGMLEPVVNRDGADPATMDLVMESGYSWLEEQQEQARRQAAEREILRQVEAEPPA